MSSFEMRRAAPMVQAPPGISGGSDLATCIAALGIIVPDQEQARHMMEATRLGLSPRASKLRVAIAWFRRLRHDPYTVYAYTDFVGGICSNWGGAPPDPVRESARKIADLPGVRLFVHATHDDPWLIAERNGEQVIVHGWYRKGFGFPSIQIV